MMCPNFWRYKDAFPDLQSEMFSFPHICAILLAVAVTLVCAFSMRTVPKEKIKRLLRVLSIVVLLMEIFFFLWDFINGKRSLGAPDYATILPVYTCSLINYTLLGAAWGKGFVERCSLAYLGTIGLIAGASGILLVNGLRSYPFWTLGALYSFTYHFLMFFVGCILLATGYYQPKWSDVFYAFVPISFLAVIAIPVDYIFQADYMLLYEGKGAPVLPLIAQSLGKINLRGLYTVIALLIYLPVTALMIAIDKVLVCFFQGFKADRCPHPQNR